MSSIVNDRLNDLYKKYFKNNEYKVGQSFDAVKSNMTNEDYDLSQKLMDYYGRQNIAKNQFDLSSNEIEHQRNKALQQNDIARQKALKYLPEYQRLQGMGGLGTSESAMIATKNNFTNNRNTINADANSKIADILDKYQTAMNNYDASYLNDAQSIIEKYKVAKQSDSTTLANEFIDNLENFRFNNTEEMDSAYGQIEDRLSEIDKINIENRIKSYRNNPTVKELGDEYNETIKNKKADPSIINGEKLLTFNGNNYQITDSQELGSSDLDTLKAVSLELLGTNNPYSTSIADGTTIDIMDIADLWARKNWSEGDYNRYMKPSLEVYKKSGKSECLTYYNGKWYKSTKK